MPAKHSTLTQSRLKELLHYNPDTGIFTWKTKPSNRVKIGGIAGSIDYLGYVRIRIDRKIYQAHRLAFLYAEGLMPPDEVDHINHNRDDNRWVNLRNVSRKENCKNASIPKHNTSGIVGVGWDVINSKWRAQIKVNGKNKNIGRFVDYFDAVCARKLAELEFDYHPNHGSMK